VRAIAAVPASGVIAGAALGLLFPHIPASVLAAFAALCGVAAVRAWHLTRPRTLAASVCLAFAAGGALLSTRALRETMRPSLRAAFDELAADERVEADAHGKTHPEELTATATIVGRLRSDAVATPVGASLSLDIEQVWMPCPRWVEGGVLLTVTGAIARQHVDAWRAGRTVRLTAQLRRAARYLDPGVPDQERALARRGTTLVGSVKSGALVEVVSKGHALAEAAASVRATVRRVVGRSVGIHSPRAAGIVIAILIGDRTGLDDDIETRLQEAGTYHVLAISGGNIAILTGLILLVFRWTGVLDATAMITAITALLSYAYLVGGGASVNRATFMAVVYLSGRALDLRGPPWNALALVAGLLVVANPLTVADPGFLLTFGATAGILVSVSFDARHRWPRGAAPAVSLFIASVAAELALFPVSAFMFSRVTLAGPVMNFAAIPLMAITQIAGMLLLPMAALSARAAGVVAWVAYASAEGLVRSAELVRFTPALTWRVAPPHWSVIVLYYTALTAIVAIARGAFPRFPRPGRRRMRVAAAAMAAGAALWIVAEPWMLVAARADGRLHVTFLDVGQGDAAFVHFPNGANAIVDTGGLSGSSSFNVGDRIVAPVLRLAGVRRLDTLVLTHGDADHVGGAESLLAEFRPRQVWEGIPVPPFAPLQHIRAAAQHAGATWVNVQTADRVAVGDVDVIVRHPGLPDWERQQVRNDDSIVLELRWRDVSIVLTGDISQEVEGEIASRIPRAKLRIVKVPHHGSASSSSEPFLRALRPQVAVVSVGRTNSFGHPAPAVLDRYRSVGAQIFRTDQDGAVAVVTDGQTTEIDSYTGRHMNIETR